MRAMRNCARQDLPAVAPDVDLAQLTGYLGRQKDHTRDMSVWRDKRGRPLPIDWQKPPEDPQDGCPGAWYRSAFAESVMPYLRRRDANGARVQNHRLDECGDRLIIDAVYFVEDQQERAHALASQYMVERMRN